EDARHRIRERRPYGSRVAGIDEQAQQPTHRLADGVERRELCVRSIGAKSRDGAVDQAGVYFAHTLPADAQAVGDSRTEVLDEHIGGGEESGHHLTGARRTKVDREAPLASVVGDEPWTVLALPPRA